MFENHNHNHQHPDGTNSIFDSRFDNELGMWCGLVRVSVGRVGYVCGLFVITIGTYTYICARDTLLALSLALAWLAYYMYSIGVRLCVEIKRLNSPWKRKPL